jgi:hypothetical protein
MHLAIYVGLLHTSLETIAAAYREVGRGHGEEPDVSTTCELLAGRIDYQLAKPGPVVDRYGEHREQEPERLHAAGLESTRTGPVGLLRDLQDLYVLASLTDVTWTVVGQTARRGRRPQDRGRTVPVTQRNRLHHSRPGLHLLERQSHAGQRLHDLDETSDPVKSTNATHLVRRLRDNPYSAAEGSAWPVVRCGSARSGRTAGPCNTEPSTSNREPWHGQSQLRSALLNATRQPRCVQRAFTACKVPSASR